MFYAQSGTKVGTTQQALWYCIPHYPPDFQVSLLNARRSIYYECAHMNVHTHIQSSTQCVHFCPNFFPPLTCTSEKSNFILSLEVRSSKGLKSTYAVTHPNTHTHTLTLQMYSHYYCARNTIKEVLCLHLFWVCVQPWASHLFQQPSPLL